MEHKIEWMKAWCKMNGVELVLDGEVGFGRPCVGISAHGYYPDYDPEEVWVPMYAYHKHDCVAVLGTDEKSVEQLYKWLVYFSEHNFVVRITDNPEPVPEDELDKMFYPEKLLNIVKGE